MRGYAHDVAPRLRMSFDGNTLYVSQYMTPIPNFHGHWEDVAIFTTEQSWNESPFSKMVQSEYYKEMIMWHWIDVCESN